ncbi:ATP-sensitive inward rectifier potassium channel 10 [Pleurocapsales cyanobacterium LEGE 10410]|nr:ATP-sensitive inward rectifier potassium channel 10 [Pleurocapsales cyanobacterium LEGE 10410]
MLPLPNPRRREHPSNRNPANRRTTKFKINFRNGRFEIPGVDTWHSYWREPYYLMLTVPWWGFLGLTAIAYGAINVFFALGYLIGGDCIANAEPGSFRDAFFFSVQTLASIGYGSMYPTCTYADVLVTIEALIGTVGIALMTGLAFAKFSQPTAKIVFSKVAVIAEHNGIPTLMFRAANQRHNQILEAQVYVYLMRDEISAEGEFMRRFYLLDLLRNRTPRFTLSWTIMHPIDETSPLWKATPESLAKTRAMLVVSLNGIDETVYNSIHAPYSYIDPDILWNHRFIDIFHQTADGQRYIDFKNFHQTKRVT